MRSRELSPSAVPLARRLLLLGDDDEDLGALRPEGEYPMGNLPAEDHRVSFGQLDRSMRKSHIDLPLHDEQHFLPAVLGSLVACRFVERRMVDESLEQAMN